MKIFLFFFSASLYFEASASVPNYTRLINSTKHNNLRRKQQQTTKCGCSSCISTVLNKDASGFSVRSRIDWIESNSAKNEAEACQLVCGIEFPEICGFECDPSKCSSSSNNAPISPTTPAVQTYSTSVNKCGGAVNAGQYNCAPDLWSATGDNSMHCYAYGGGNDPCALHNNNDYNNGLDKDPSACAEENSDTFYLWDEPDTQGKSYSWAGTQWAMYAQKFSIEIQLLKQKGIKVTSPMVTAGSSGQIKERMKEFYNSCGSSCSDPNSSAYIDVIAINAFCGPWNINDSSNPSQGCRNGASFIVNEANRLSVGEGGGLPVYITNWSRLRVSKAMDQLAAIDATDEFFREGSPIERVYWFGAEDYGGGSSKNFLTDIIETGNRAGQTLGEAWKNQCDEFQSDINNATPIVAEPPQNIVLDISGNVANDCRSICQGEYPHGCSTGLSSHVKYGCHPNGGCFYANDFNTPYPFEGFCTYKVIES